MAGSLLEVINIGVLITMCSSPSAVHNTYNIEETVVYSKTDCAVLSIDK
ncbi:hypothetical protein [Histophilus somni]|nr:hypothetical protein [Histophilus somni]